MSMPAATPLDVNTLPSSTQRASGTQVVRGPCSTAQAFGRLVDFDRLQRIRVEPGLIEEREPARRSGGKDEFRPADHANNLIGPKAARGFGRFMGAKCLADATYNVNRAQGRFIRLPFQRR
jgi:hypothetical protein